MLSVLACARPWDSKSRAETPAFRSSRACRPLLAAAHGHLGYSSSTQRSIPRIVKDSPHFTMHRRTEISFFHSYSWIMVQTFMRATKATKLHSISQQLVVASRFLRNYSSSKRRSIYAIPTDLHHFSLHQSMDSLMFCSYYCITRPSCMYATPTG